MQRTLLAILLCNPNRPVTAQALNVAIWGVDSPRNTDGLRVHVHHLRKALGEGRLARRNGGYQLEVGPDELDAAVYRRLTEAAQQLLSNVDHLAARDMLRRALQAWRGPAFADLDSPGVVRAEAAILDEHRLGTLERCFGHELALGRHAEVCGEIRAVATVHPYREGIQGQLMLALYRGHRRVEALDVYTQTRRLLAEELGVDPSRQLRDLRERILRDDPDLAAPRDTAVLATARTRPGQVPAAPSDFTGRRGDLEQLDAIAQHGDVGVVALVGMPGVGKSALSARWAHLVRDRFPDGQLYINLRGYASVPAVRPIDAMAALLRGLGIAADHVPTDIDEAAGLYRTMLDGRRVLVLLDNAHSAEQVRPLLPGSPECLALVTSRDRLSGLVAHDGARRVIVDVLDGDESTALLRRVLGYQADHEPTALRRLADACGHLPLALRIAAANLADGRYASVAAYVDTLSSSGVLDSLQVDGDERSSVRAAFDLSYAALEPDLCRFFRLVALAPGLDVGTAGAAALADTTPEQAAQQLALLARNHLIGQPAIGTWSMHNLIRAYAHERATAEESDALREAAVGRFCA